VRRLHKRGNFVSLDLVEINPSLDPKENFEKIFGDSPHIEAT
jgi:arginase family enzyme